mgnify:CR=1 FL=1
MPKGSDILVSALENEGVERIFGVPGEENLDLVESLACVEKDALSGPDDRVRRVEALVLRDAIDLEYDRRTRNIGHPPDRLVLKDDPCLAAGDAANDAAIGKVLKV